MNLAGFRFRPPWWAWVITLIAIVLFVNRALWQLDRADQKERLIEQRAEAIAMSAKVPVGLEMAHGGALRLKGAFLPERQFLLDNQIHDSANGVHVWTPFRARHDGRIYLINRGWLAWQRGADPVPAWQTPGEPVQVYGQWRQLPVPGMRLGENACPAENWPAVVQYPTHAELECLLGQPLRDGVLLLHPDAGHGFDRNWAEAEMPVEKHLGYALQWASFAVASLVLFVVLNLRRRKTGEKSSDSI